MRSRTRSVLLVLLTTIGLSAAPGPQLDRLSRLEILADLWSKVYLFHPRIATGEVDYNEVLLNAIPRVEQTTSDADFVRVLNEHVLAPLRDVQTSAQLATAERCGPRPSGPPPELRTLKLAPGVGLVRVRDPRPEADRITPFLDRFHSAVDDLGPIEKLVVDLRYEVDVELETWTTYWLGLFTDKPLEQAHYLQREHEGLNEFNSPNNAYRQRWRVDGGDVLARAFWNGVIREPILMPVLFVVNNASYPRYARTLDTLQRAGRAAVLWEDSGCSVGPDVERFAGDIRMFLNARHLLAGDGLDGARPNHISAARVSDQQIASFANELLSGLSPRPETALVIPPLRLRSYESPVESLKDRQQRLFWMIKVWMGIRHYFPHLEYASMEWNTALREWIPRFEAAGSADEFFDLVRQMTAPLNDSHIRVVAPNGHPSRSLFFPAVRLGRVEGKVIVTAVEGEAQRDVAPGDEVMSIDGRSVTRIEEYMRARISASTEGAFQRAWNIQTQGQRDTEIALTLNRNGASRTVNLRRSRSQPLAPKFTPVRTLDGGIGYLNLFEFKTEEELESAFSDLRTSRGLLLDLRGYPTYNGFYSFWQQRLYSHPVKSLLNDHTLLVRHRPQELSYVKTYEYHEPIPAQHYAGPVVVLINAEAQSYPEGVAIELTTDHRVTFVGSPTAGTTGGTTVLNLPGGWWLEFTGARVSYPDGRRFQNIGVVPDVTMEPTIRGVAARIDEVFERGVEVLRSQIRY